MTAMIILAIFVSIHFLAAVFDLGNKHYAPNLIFACVEFISFIFVCTHFGG